MSTNITNRGMFERDSSGNITTNLTKTAGEIGTVRVVYQGIEYVFGPGETKSFSDNGIASALVTASGGRLVNADSRHGFPKSNATTSTYRF